MDPNTHTQLFLFPLDGSAALKRVGSAIHDHSCFLPLARPPSAPERNNAAACGTVWHSSVWRWAGTVCSGAGCFLVCVCVCVQCVLVPPGTRCGGKLPSITHACMCRAAGHISQSTRTCTRLLQEIKNLMLSTCILQLVEHKCTHMHTRIHTPTVREWNNTLTKITFQFSLTLHAGPCLHTCFRLFSMKLSVHFQWPCQPRGHMHCVPGVPVRRLRMTLGYGEVCFQLCCIISMVFSARGSKCSS